MEKIETSIANQITNGIFSGTLSPEMPRLEDRRSPMPGRMKSFAVTLIETWVPVKRASMNQLLSCCMSMNSKRLL